MKKYLLLGIPAVLLFSSCDKEKSISVDDTPSEIKSYIQNHFPDEPILQVIKDKDGLVLTYDVLLEDMTSLEFNRKKEIQDIQSSKELPGSVIPDKIEAYVEERFAENYIIGWELDDKNQQVELDNGIDIEFKMDGSFVKIED